MVGVINRSSQLKIFDAPSVEVVVDDVAGVVRLLDAEPHRLQDEGEASVEGEEVGLPQNWSQRVAAQALS